MSYRIEYQWACLALKPDETPGLKEPIFVIAIEGGDNNVYTSDWRTGAERRSRHWEIGMFGTADQVMRQAVRFASSCESGCLKPRGKDCTPEAYIARIARLLAKPINPNTHLSLHARLKPDHPLCHDRQPDYFLYRDTAEYGQKIVKVTPMAVEDWARYIEAVSPYLDDFSLQPWRLGMVYNFASS